MADQPAITDVISSITSDIKTIVQGEIELAKAEMVPQAKKVGLGVGLFGGAGYFALNGMILAYIALSFLASALYLAALSPAWAYTAGFATIAVLFFVIAAVLALIGKSRFDVAGPEATITQAEQSVDAVVTAVNRGQANVAALTPSNAREPERAITYV